VEELFYVLEHMYRLTHIPVRCFDAPGTIVLFNRGYKKEADPLIQGGYLPCFLSAVKSKKSPTIEFEDDMNAYGGFIDTSECIVALGPARMLIPTQEDIALYAKQHNIPEDNFYIIEGGMVALGSAIALLQMIRHGQAIHGNELFSTDDSAERTIYEKDAYTITNIEAEILRHNYDYEKTYIDQIKHGDYESLKNRRADKNAAERIGRMAKKPIKHLEYMICTSICLATRAAMDGGLDPASAYSLSDIYLQRLENCNDINKIFALHQEMSVNFAKQVYNAQQKRSESSYVEKVKVYINQRLNTPFTLDDVAQAANINKFYLSRIFTQQEKMSIMAYARKKRIEAAANMLKFSEENISTIANYLCFRNQSHFSQTFKEIVGTTPRKFRATRQTIEVRK